MARISVLQLGSPTGLYGAERWILALVKHLDPDKVKTVVAAIRDCPTLEVPLCHEAEKLGVRTLILKAYGKINFAAIKKLKKFIKEKRIQILHTHGYKQDLIGLCAIQGTGCKIVTTPHGWSTQAGVKLRCYEMLDRCIFPFFDAVVPLSADIFRPLKRIPGLSHKLYLIRNGIDISEIDAATQVADEMIQWKKGGAVVLGYIGQLISRKGLDVLLKALARIDSINWRLAIVGDGEQRYKLEDLSQRLNVDRQVKFFGFQKDRLSLLRGFDVFILPSRLEGIPRSLMEAMAAGIPVVVSDIAGNQDLVDDNQTGLVFPRDRDDLLACAIQALASDVALRNKLGRTARELILSRFSAGQMAQAYTNLFERLSDRSCQ